MEYNVVVSVKLLSSLAGVALSLVFSYIPGLRARFAKLDGVYKRLVMAGLLLLASLLIMAGVCAGFVVGDGLTCGRDGALVLLSAFVSAAIANQTAYVVSGVAQNVTLRVDEDIAVIASGNATFALRDYDGSFDLGGSVYLENSAVNDLGGVSE